jgi:hypothetical protein
MLLAAASDTILWEIFQNDGSDILMIMLTVVSEDFF